MVYRALNDAAGKLHCRVCNGVGPARFCREAPAKLAPVNRIYESTTSMFTINRKPATTLLFALLGTAPLALAQGMDAAQMQQMMENAQKMQACMSEVDQSAMEAMARDAQAFQQQIKALCAAGKRDQAMSDAIAYGQQVNASPEMQKMQACRKYMEGMMPAIPLLDAPTTGGSHICDE